MMDDNDVGDDHVKKITIFVKKKVCKPLCNTEMIRKKKTFKIHF